jgi:hypothetical protein
MSNPEKSIAALDRRIRAVEKGEPSAVLDRRALVDSSAMPRRYAGGDGGAPFEAARVVAWLHWCRYQALPQGADRDDLVAALDVFNSLAAVEAQIAPGPVLR